MRELHSELEAARAELALARTARAALAAQRHTAEQGRLEDFTAEIRRLTEEKAALQAQCDMARAHLRALSGMLSSSLSQVRSRQEVLHSLLLSLEEEWESVDGDQEDEEERNLKERLKQLESAALPQERPFEGNDELHARSQEEVLRLTSEIGKLQQAALELQDGSEVPWALSELRGATELKGLWSQQRSEETKRSSREMRLDQLRSEVAERQSHFDRMTDDLLAQVSHLKDKVSDLPDALPERFSLRDSERLTDLRRDQDASRPPAPLVEPRVPDRLPLRREEMPRRGVRPSLFEERVSQLKAVIGASLQSLDDVRSDSP